jgi:SagB-type dehydrogenase family enzyme
MERGGVLVTAGSSRTPLARELEWQNVGSKLSSVRPVSCPVDPMRRYWFLQRPFVAKESPLAMRLRAVQNLFEWAYGYREPVRPDQRFTRRAPSAGALYPTEVFLIIETDEEWRALYYHFPGHQFYLSPVVNAKMVVHLLGLKSGCEAILFNSILWRTVQRYGVRGYRYCLLDAAHVAANLVRAASACGQKIQVMPGVLTTQLEEAMELGHGEALTIALFSCKSDDRVPAPVIPVKSPSVVIEVSECPPLLCPVLSRVISFHRATLYAHSNPQHLQEAPVPLGNSLKLLECFASARNSAKDFTGDYITYHTYLRIIKAVTTSSPVCLGQSAQIIAYVIRLRVKDLSPGCERLTDGSTPPATAVSAEDVGRHLWLACSSQNIVKSCAFAIVLTARESELAASGHIGYRHTVQ